MFQDKKYLLAASIKGKVGGGGGVVTSSQSAEGIWNKDKIK